MHFDRIGSAGYLTNSAGRLFVRAIDRRLQAIGLSAAHMPVFLALADGQSLSQKELAAAAAVEQPTMAATLARMERDGLIDRTPDPSDRRSSLVSLSAKAHGKTATLMAAARDTNGVALSGLGADERELFLNLLRRVIAALEQDG